MKSKKMIEKAKFLAETLYEQNWKSADDIKKMMEQNATKLYEDFLTGERGLSTLLTYSEGFVIHASFPLWKLLNERYENLMSDMLFNITNPWSDDVDEDERWFASGVFKITIYKDQESKEMWIDHLCDSGVTLRPKRT